MKEQRLSKRYNSDKACLLKLGCDFCAATVENISFGGVLVRTSYMQHGLRVADKFNISIHGEFLREYPCKVIRVEPSYVALEFISWHLINWNIQSLN